jgi:hypothetical protein
MAHGRRRHRPDTAHRGFASFWFFSPANVELLVKVLDGCGNQRFWGPQA